MMIPATWGSSAAIRQAVPEDINLFLIDLGNLGEQGYGINYIVDYFVFHGERRVGLGVGAVLFRPLDVAQYSYVLAGEAIREVSEGLVCTDRFVGVLRA